MARRTPGLRPSNDGQIRGRLPRGHVPQQVRLGKARARRAEAARHHQPTAEPRAINVLPR